LDVNLNGEGRESNQVKEVERFLGPEHTASGSQISPSPRIQIFEKEGVYFKKLVI
jgi:hypothetical protein